MNATGKRSSARREWQVLESTLAVLLGLLLLLNLAASTLAEESPDSSRSAVVERVVDGDTLVLEGGERVRLIGVDTPESVHPRKPVEYFGKEASAFTKKLAEGKRVRLERDPTGDTRDRYGRALAHVYLPDGRHLNLELIRQGYGFAYTRFPFSMMDAFRAAEREAREQGRGLWARSDRVRRQGGPESPDQQPRAAPWAAPDAGSCIPRAQCCQVCSKSRACGDACIPRSSTCSKGSGCACDGARLCP